MPTAESTSNKFGHWSAISDQRSGESVRVRKFRSEKTNLSVIIGDVEGPLVNGYFCLATEAHDDDGLPHTLEHLIFLGSEEFPYKGVLDLIANRCLSSGTNAWTDTDHTCYTMTTVGSEGFLSMFPVYVDHILFPTLTESGYVTEVHHVNGDGEDAGVVYCEMQGRENSGESRVHLAMIRALFPGHCGYKSETGGIMKNLRESTSHEKVKNYHEMFYRPENLCLIVTGIIEPEKVFEALEAIEEKILKREVTPFQRPWQNEVPEFKSEVELSVPYPCDDEDNGMVYVGWRGPSGVGDFKKMYATIALMEYLTESSVSPLNAAFVEIDDPLASSVSYILSEQKDCAVYLCFENVPVPKLELIKPNLVKCFSEIVLGNNPIDKKRMSVILERRISELKAAIEVSPHDLITNMVIADALYGQENEDLHARLNPDKYYHALLSETADFWSGLLAEISQKPKVFSKGIPSKKLQEEMAKEEEERIEEQKKLLGESGLKRKQEMFESAVATNEIEAPAEVFEKFNVPSVDSISFHPEETFQTSAAANKTNTTAENRESSKLLQNIRDNFKYPGVFSNVKSNFVYLNALMDTEDIPENLRAYLPLFGLVLMESPIEVGGGQTLSYEEVVRLLDADIVSRAFSIGVSGATYFTGSFSNAAFLSLQVESNKYAKGVKWIEQLLTKTVFSPERIKIVAIKAENGIAEYKRAGRLVAKSLHSLLLFNKNSNQFWNVIPSQQTFLKELLKQLNSSSGAEKIVKDLNELRRMLVKKVSFYSAANFNKMDIDPLSPWTNLSFEYENARDFPAVAKDNQLVKGVVGGTHLMVGLGSVESSFLIRSTPGITDYQDPDLPALMLYFQYLTQLEGPMWRKIRGSGLSYGYSLSVDVNQGQIVLSLTKSTHPSKAFEAATKIIFDSLNQTDFEFDKLEFESAKSSLVFELVDKLQSVAGVIVDNLFRILKQVGPNHKREFLDRVMKVSLNDLKRVGQKYVTKILDPSLTRTVLVCHPSKVERIQQEFQNLGMEFKVFKNLDEVSEELI